jgi:hypothetical protein
MITKDKIRIFNKYDGNIDSWARSGSKKEKLIISDDDWYIISTHIQDLFLVKKGLTSEDFNNSLKNKLKETCDSEDTIKQLETIAKEKQ